MDVPVTAQEVEAARAYRERIFAHAQVAARLTPEEKEIAGAVRMEASARAQIASIEEAGGDSREFRALLARSLRDQGRLDEAAEVFPEAREAMERGKAAIARPDTDDCGHSRDALFIKRRIYTIARGWLYLTECAECGDLNARASLPARIYG